MFKKFIIICTLLLTANIAQAQNAVVAQQPNQYEVKRIAVIDVKKVMDESVASKDAQSVINTIKQQYYKEIEEADKKLQGRKKELSEQKSAMSPEAFGKKVVEFEQKIQTERKEAAKKQKIVEAAFVKSLELIRDETVRIINEMSQEKNFDMVIPTSQLLFSKPGFDITTEVITKLNQRLTKVNINIKPEEGKAPAKDASKAADTKDKK